MNVIQQKHSSMGPEADIYIYDMHAIVSFYINYYNTSYEPNLYAGIGTVKIREQHNNLWLCFIIKEILKRYFALIYYNFIQFNMIIFCKDIR